MEDELGQETALPCCFSCRLCFSDFVKDASQMVMGVAGAPQQCPSGSQYFCKFCRVVHLPCVNLDEDENKELLAGLGSSAEEAGVSSSSTSSPSSSGGAVQTEGKDTSKAPPVAYVVSIIASSGGCTKQVYLAER